MIIQSRFHGPPNSGNGGYTCGLIAREIIGPAEVTLRLPPPLDKPLDLQRTDDGSLRLLDGDRLVAEARPTTLDLDVPLPPTPEQTAAATGRFPGFQHHIFPGCFVCGPERQVGDGLRIFPGPVEGSDLLAAPWQPHPDLADDDGWARPEFVWAAMDCPGAFAVSPMTDTNRAVVLGRFTAELLAPVGTGERCTVLGWNLGNDGRKHFAGTAVFNEAGELTGKARATWIDIDLAQVRT